MEGLEGEFKGDQWFGKCVQKASQRSAWKEFKGAAGALEMCAAIKVIPPRELTPELSQVDLNQYH